MDLANQIADARLQCLTETVVSFMAMERAAWAEARAHAEQARLIARRLGSERLEAMGLEEIAMCLIGEGRQDEALRVARQSFTLCQRSAGLAVSGPSILAMQALAEPDAEASRAAIRQGEELLAAGCVCHAHFHLREAAIALALARGEWDEARRHAGALESHFASEPPARAVLVVELARLFADLGPGPGAVEAAGRVAALRAQARAAGLAALAVWPATFTAV